MQQRQLLLGVSLLLIFCWTIGSIWLISVRREEGKMAAIKEDKERLSLLLPAAKGHNSQPMGTLCAFSGQSGVMPLQ
jgi:hypothetical protein